MKNKERSGTRGSMGCGERKNVGRSQHAPDLQKRKNSHAAARWMRDGDTRGRKKISERRARRFVLAAVISVIPVVLLVALEIHRPAAAPCLLWRHGHGCTRKGRSQQSQNR